MAKKKTTKKKVTKTTTKSKKKVAKAVTKKKVAKKTTKKKAATKKKSTKKVAKKAAKKAPAKKKVTKKKVTKKKVTKKKAAKKQSTKKKSNAKKAKSKPSKAPAKKVTKKKSPGSKRSTIKYAKPPASALAVIAEESVTPLSKSALKKVDSGLSRKEKEAFRKMLLEKRLEILGDMESLRDGALGDDGDISHMPLHMADAGTDQYEQEANLGLMESERKTLQDIFDALVRLSEGTYGVCVETGKPIGKARLEYKPWAKYCIEVAAQKEQQRYKSPR